MESKTIVRNSKYWLTALIFLSFFNVSHAASVHIAYHWHLHQPIYWPAPVPGTDRLQFAADSFDLKARGAGFYPGSPVQHPENNLATGDIGAYDPVFSNADRVRIYQAGGHDAIWGLLSYPDAGASISYSGSLMDNVDSWGKSSRMGYAPNWNYGYSQARTWKTSSGAPRADLVGFTYHHSLAPLLPKAVFRKELQLFKKAWAKTWNGLADQSDQSKGFFPSEVAFSETLIPTPVQEGYQWSIVANGHLARSCRNYLDADVAPNHSNSTWNTNPPNRADMTGPQVPADQWWSGTLDGRGAKLPAPYAYQPHWARYVDPETGKDSKIVIVPMDDVLSYRDGYSPQSPDTIDAEIAPWSQGQRPSLVLLAHDGDNAWAGGFSYYYEAVPQFSALATRRGYHMNTIQQFLQDNPVPATDVVHIEDGGWINPEGDWGDPQFVKWLYPPARSPKDPAYNPRDPRTFIDIENGFSTSWRSWAVIIAGANYCESAEQIDPKAAEKCWEFYLAGLDSGFMYYGDSLDDEVKQSLAVNHAIPYAKRVIRRRDDRTPPTVFRPQRWPHNPGGIGWGVTTRYMDVGTNGKPPHSSDFYVWTLVHDVSGVSDVTLHVRSSRTGTNSPADDDNETYAGGPSVSAWTSIKMNQRVIDPKFTGDPPNPKINYFIQPVAIADHYWAKVTGYHDVLLDYYVEATDSLGNRSKSDIFHVWVGSRTVISKSHGRIQEDPDRF